MDQNRQTWLHPRSPAKLPHRNGKSDARRRPEKSNLERNPSASRREGTDDQNECTPLSISEHESQLDEPEIKRYNEKR